MTTKKEPWWKANIFSIISLIIVVAGGFAYGVRMTYKMEQSFKDVEQLKKDIVSIKSLGTVKDMQKHINDEIFKIKTSLYKEIEKIEILFKEKFRNSEKREQEFRQDIKELQRSLYRIKRSNR